MVSIEQPLPTDLSLSLSLSSPDLCGATTIRVSLLVEGNKGNKTLREMRHSIEDVRERELHDDENRFIGMSPSH